MGESKLLAHTRKMSAELSLSCELDPGFRDQAEERAASVVGKLRSEELISRSLDAGDLSMSTYVSDFKKHMKWGSITKYIIYEHPGWMVDDKLVDYWKSAQLMCEMGIDIALKHVETLVEKSEEPHQKLILGFMLNIVTTSGTTSDVKRMMKSTELLQQLVRMFGELVGEVVEDLTRVKPALRTKYWMDRMAMDNKDGVTLCFRALLKFLALCINGSKQSDLLREVFASFDFEKLTQVSGIFIRMAREGKKEEVINILTQRLGFLLAAPLYVHGFCEMYGEDVVSFIKKNMEKCAELPKEPVNRMPIVNCLRISIGGSVYPYIIVCSAPGCYEVTDRDCVMRQCGRCRLSRYCSRECQKAHWKYGHKKWCQDPDSPVSLESLEEAAEGAQGMTVHQMGSGQFCMTSGKKPLGTSTTFTSKGGDYSTYTIPI